MTTIRTQTGYQLGNWTVDSKPFSKLPTQQARTLLLVAKGLPQQGIADELGVKVSTVKKACKDLSYRFDTYSMRETVNKAISEGVLRYAFAVLLCLFASANDDVERSFRTVRTTRVTRTGCNRRLRELQIDLMSV